jgi:dolichol-phosphate mannosyltransferase
MNDKPLLSVVIPIYFEEQTIHEFYQRTKNVMTGLAATVDHELIFVNDGSTDRSLPLLKELARNDEQVRVISFSRNFGHQIAITAGIERARGDAVVVIDGDLQDPPEVIAQMLTKWREGFQVVYGVRARRKGEKALKLLTASLFYRLMGKLSDVKLPLDAGDFRLMDRAVVQALVSLKEENRYIRGLVSWIGFNQCGVSYERDARYAGETKFNFRKMFRFAFDGITSFSDKPLRLSSYGGVIITGFSFLGILWLIYAKLTRPETLVQGWASMLIVVLFLGGVQLISVGILGEYIGRIYRETKQRPLYIVAEQCGFATGDSTSPHDPVGR